MDNHIIYVHINKINNKIYIGQATGTLNKRTSNGNGYKSCTAFNNAIQKYGWDNFEHVVLFENLSKEMADIIEHELIIKYMSYKPNYGYNIRLGGNNYYVSDEIMMNRYIKRGVFVYCLDTNEMFESATLAAKKIQNTKIFNNKML